jgi:two-component system, sensor histidine kinase and response regulator
MFIKNATNLILYLMGSEKDFEPEHRFLNLICLLASVSFFISFPGNLLLGMSLRITLVSLFACGVCFFLYYLSRFCGQVKYTFISFFVFTTIILSIQWFLNGGIYGGISYFFISLLITALFLFQGKIRVIFSLVFIIFILALLTIEYFNPQWVSGYTSRKQLFIDHTANFLTAVPFYILTVYFNKKLYQKEKKNAATIIEQYRESSEYLKEQMNEKLKVLSVRERDVFRLIIEAKSNKEISDILNICLPTVKTHINNIYKKLNVVKRIDIANMFQ